MIWVNRGYGQCSKRGMFAGIASGEGGDFSPLLAQVGKGWKSGLMSLEPADIQGERARSPWIGEAWAYRCMVAFGVLFAAAAAFGIAAVGTMMWAYCVSFHITHGPPVWGSVGKASS